MRLSAVLGVLIVLVSALGAPAQEQQAESGHEASVLEKYRELGGIEEFGIITVSLTEKEQQLGLVESELTDYVVQRITHKIAGMKHKDLAQRRSPLHREKPEIWKKVGVLRCAIRTDDKQDTIYFDAQCEGGYYRNPRIWGDAIRGFVPRENITFAVKKSLDEIVNGFASTYFQAKGMPYDFGR